MKYFFLFYKYNIKYISLMFNNKLDHVNKLSEKNRIFYFIILIEPFINMFINF